MSKVDMKSYREQVLNLKGGQVNEVYFIDTKPNFVYITNLGSADLYASDNPNVNQTKHEIIVSSNMKRSIVKPLGLHKIYVYPMNDIQVKIESGIAELSMSDIPMTQIIATMSNSLSISKVDVDKIIQPLPTGSNKIGMVSVENMASVTGLLTDIKNLLTTANGLLTDIKNKP